MSVTALQVLCNEIDNFLSIPPIFNIDVRFNNIVQRGQLLSSNLALCSGEGDQGMFILTK